MDAISIIVLVYIVAVSTATGILLNWQQVKRGWTWCKRLWASIRKILAGFLLLFAFGCIFAALWFFGPYFYKIYFVLSDQINTEYLDALKPKGGAGEQVGGTDKQVGGTGIIDSYFSISIRYFGIVAAAGAIIGYIIAIARNIISDNQNKIADEQNKVSERGQITESMGQAITQIGTFNDKNPNIEVRLGGIYSLERIARDSDRDYAKIMDILCAYVRSTALRKSGYSRSATNIREDIQSAIDVLGSEIEELSSLGKKPKFRINLENCNLSGYNFSEGDFNKHTENDKNGAIFDKSKFEKSRFYKTDLSYASFDKADLTKAVFEEAILKGARLVAANCKGVIFKNTKVHGADFSNAKNLTQKQVNKMIGDKKTKLPKDLVLSKIEESPN